MRLVELFRLVNLAASLLLRTSGHFADEKVNPAASWHFYERAANLSRLKFVYTSSFVSNNAGLLETFRTATNERSLFGYIIMAQRQIQEAQ